MFNAILLSLSDGQSYENVKVFEDADIIERGIPKVFEDWTACFIHQGDLIIAHHWKVKVMKISNDRIGPGVNSIRVDRLILDGDIVYPDVNLMSHTEFEKRGIPHYFVKRDGIAGQMTFVCNEGTFITHDTNVSSLIFKKSTPEGVIRSQFTRGGSAKQISKQNLMPQTVHGKISDK